MVSDLNIFVWKWSKIAAQKKFKQSEKKKNKKLYFFLPLRFYTLYKQKFSNLRQILSITFPQGFRISKILDIGLWEVGAKRPINGVRKCDRQTTVRSLAPICRSTTSTLFTEHFFRQSHTARDRQIKSYRITRYKLTAPGAICIIAVPCNDM